MEYFVVFLCGCTDCFPSAMFLTREDADEWGKKHGSKCDGYTVHPCETLEQVVAEFRENEV